uniref:Uncharacterized protein n=1 Tax=Branchiostoma floridae TaxID=7739 RepID=C3YE85_BRAFL|eukprot:XP_002605383.1 hypothetical protein BRAFLDRAFT_74203 [Branchiostoma floridae]
MQLLSHPVRFSANRLPEPSSCKECYFIRQLPQEYYPPILNERKCQGQTCLKGYGQCEQQYSSVNVLQNLNQGNWQAEPRWQRVQVQVEWGCKCTVNQNSPFASWVA